MEVQVKNLPYKINSKICFLSKDLFEALKLSKEKTYKLHLGQISGYVSAKPSKKQGKYIYFSRTVFNRLLPHQNRILNIWKKGEEIFLGPVVGIFVNTRHLKAIKKGNISFNTQKHAEAGNASHCLSYYFSIDEINWDERRIKGYTFASDTNKWEQHWLPMPDVIYDKGVGFRKEQKSFVRHIHQKFKEIYKISYINSYGYLSKWDVHKGLLKYSEIANYLPKTIVYKNFDDVLSMLKKYKFIFVKASVGWRGKQVLSIENAEEKYKLNFVEGGLREIILDDISDLKLFVEKFAKRRRIIVQQGIRLLKYNGHNMDIRVLMLKNGKGDWEAVRMPGRIAKEAFTITNMAAGGECKSYEIIYPNLHSSNCKGRLPDKDKIVDVTKKIIFSIEKEFGSFGEIGMDMAVDIYGKIWFIEANTRPDKLTNPSNYGPMDIPPQALNIFEYSKFLAELKKNY